MMQGLDREAFLGRIWQRTPLLIPGALPDFTPPISSNELAGLALEEHIESRIVEYTDKRWLLHHGPFCAADFTRKTPWTLLVQAVDHYLPEVAALRQLVDFIPRWRFDDIMVSYAVDGGSVGPHYDNYDVFLLQGEGQRLWRIGQQCDATVSLLPHDELRLLDDFQCQEEHLLNCGDVLYVPPGVAHWGISQGDGTTFSIGFRAPRINDMVSRFADQLLEQLDPDKFYRDPALGITHRAGEISPTELAQVSQLLSQAMAGSHGNRWFGELVTEPRYATSPSNETLPDMPNDTCTSIRLASWARVAWHDEGEQIALFANGVSDLYSKSVLPWVLQLCAEGPIEGELLRQLRASREGERLMRFLLEQECLHG